MDGPVVTAARRALDAHDPMLVLAYVKKDGEAEVLAAYDRAMAVRDGNTAVNDLADLYFFETVVRVHRAGEGAPYTGLKPAGLDVGPVIPIAERALETGDPTELVTTLRDTVTVEVERRFAEVLERRTYAGADIEAAREYVEAMLGLEVWCHKVHLALIAPAHEQHSEGVHEHG
jgi:hypothetical protein